MTPKVKELIQAVLDGKRLQYDGIDACESDEFLIRDICNTLELERYWVKPKLMILVNGDLVPKHETTAPAEGVDCYIASVVEPDPYPHKWNRLKYHQSALTDGLLYLNKEDAKARIRAMMKFEDLECKPTTST